LAISLGVTVFKKTYTVTAEQLGQYLHAICNGYKFLNILPNMVTRYIKIKTYHNPFSVAKMKRRFINIVNLNGVDARHQISMRQLEVKFTIVLYLPL
jgi:hypothetical protein